MKVCYNKTTLTQGGVTMNPICERSAKQDVVKISGNPNPPKNQATIANLGLLPNIDPQRTPASAYTKKVK